MVAATPSIRCAGSESWRSRAAITACSFGLILSPADQAADTGPDGLDDEQRIALGVHVQGIRGGLVEAIVGQMPAQLDGVGAREPLEWHLRDPVDQLQSPGDRQERVLGVELLRPDGDDDDQRARRRLAEEVVEQLQTRCIAPLRVVDEEEHGTTGGREGMDDGSEQTQSVGAIARAGWRRPRRAELRQQSGQLGDFGRR